MRRAASDRPSWARHRHASGARALGASPDPDGAEAHCCVLIGGACGKSLVRTSGIGVRGQEVSSRPDAAPRPTRGNRGRTGWIRARLSLWPTSEWSVHPHFGPSMTVRSCQPHGAERQGRWTDARFRERITDPPGRCAGPGLASSGRGASRSGLVSHRRQSEPAVLLGRPRLDREAPLDGGRLGRRRLSRTGRRAGCRTGRSGRRAAPALGSQSVCPCSGPTPPSADHHERGGAAPCGERDCVDVRLRRVLGPCERSGGGVELPRVAQRTGPGGVDVDRGERLRHLHRRSRTARVRWVGPHQRRPGAGHPHRGCRHRHPRVRRLRHVPDRAEDLPGHSTTGHDGQRRRRADLCAERGGARHARRCCARCSHSASRLAGGQARNSPHLRCGLLAAPGSP